MSSSTHTPADALPRSEYPRVFVSPPEPNVLSQFHLFPKLPTELRVMVWRHAIHGLAPRTVFSQTYTAKTSVFSPRLCSDMLCCDPPLLYVPETRQVFLESPHYQVHPAKRVNTFHVNGQAKESYQEGPLYFNPEIDALLAYSVGDGDTWAIQRPLTFPAELRKTVRCLAVSSDAHSVLQNTYHPSTVNGTTVLSLMTSATRFFKEFVALETLIVVLVVGTRLRGQLPLLSPIDVQEARKVDPDFARTWTSVFGFLGMPFGMNQKARKKPRMQFAKLEWK